MGGFHQEKDNRIHASFPDGETGYGLANNRVFPEGNDTNHFSAGLGVVLGERFQLDVAGDWSTKSTEFVTSLIARF